MASLAFQWQVSHRLLHLAVPFQGMDFKAAAQLLHLEDHTKEVLMERTLVHRLEEPEQVASSKH